MMAIVDLESLADARASEFYTSTLRALCDAGVPYLVGGTLAVAAHGGPIGAGNDLDLFVRQADMTAALDALQRAGHHTTHAESDATAKVQFEGLRIDVIGRFSDDLRGVDDSSFARARDACVFGVPVRLCPVEDLIWFRAFAPDRKRFDGSDVIQLLDAFSPTLDWALVMSRFAGSCRVLLTHLVLFGVVYPASRDQVPHWVLRTLLERSKKERESDFVEGLLERDARASSPSFGWESLASGEVVSNRVMAPASDEQVAYWTRVTSPGLTRTGTERLGRASHRAQRLTRPLLIRRCERWGRTPPGRLRKKPVYDGR